MEVDLKPASYGRYTVCLATKFRLQPQSSHWAKVVHGSNLSQYHFNLLKPNDIYICHTAALTSRRYILYIYSTNIHTEYFKHGS